MAALVKKIQSLLKKRFPPPAEIDLEEDKGIIGTVVSPEFKNVEMVDRVDMVWDYLEEHLSKEERSKIVLIVAMTPNERLLHSR